MNAIDTIDRITNTNLIFSDLKYCMVDKNKKPYKITGEMAKPNCVDDFVSFEDLFLCTNLDSYAGIGVSIQASQICAIDVDHCFSVANDISSATEIAKSILNKFDKIAYCEFSFSGTGLRILFRQPIIENYIDKYYIKNKNYGIEFYQPTDSYRYVTVTGNAIANNYIQMFDDNLTNITFDFLNTYMLRQKKKKNVPVAEKIETRSFEDLMKIVKFKYLTNIKFQDVWYSQAPGSGKDESERDFYLLSYLYENITQDKDLIKQIFESSPYFKSKDYKHICKWNNQDFRYYNYIYNIIKK